MKMERKKFIEHPKHCMRSTDVKLGSGSEACDANAVAADTDTDTKTAATTTTPAAAYCHVPVNWIGTQEY
jgi:hypothetical protein